MKTLKNEVTTIDVSNESTEKTTFADLAKACINNLPTGGLDVVQMSARLSILKVISKGGNELKFEDAEAETLKKCVSEMRWILVHEDVVNFLNTVKNL